VNAWESRKFAGGHGDMVANFPPAAGSSP